MTVSLLRWQVARSESQYRRITEESSKKLAVRCHHDARFGAFSCEGPTHD